VSTDNSKDAVILSRCAIFETRNCLFRFKEASAKYRAGDLDVKFPD
jgi:predicted metal-binding protein